jgi:hypothetical protein|uniref:Uncharacterized protein n=1 Tax=Bionectria ochroleuca TaxID=29856 RepID=A0A8H7N106_BIOOC
MPLESIAQLMVLVRGMRDLFTPDSESITWGPVQAVVRQVFQENRAVTLPLLLKVQLEKVKNVRYGFA